MKFCKIAFLLSVIILFSSVIFGQSNVKTKPTTTIPTASNQIKSSPAYAEIVLRRTELLSEFESLLVEYTEDYPKVKEMRYETGLLQKEIDKILSINAADSPKLTAALGKLIVRKCELETDLWSLQKQFNDAHPDVKRAKRKVEIFDAAIKDILQGK